MEKTVHYYNIFITKNGKRTSYKLNHFFDKLIYPLKDDKKLKICSKKSIALNKYIMPDAKIGGNEANIRTMAFAEYRNDKPFLGKKGTSRREDIPDDVLEVTRCVLFPNDFLIAVEYNHKGCKAGHIVTYIERFFPADQDLSIEIKQVQQNNILDKVLKSNKITSLMVHLDTSHTGVVDSLYGYAKDEERKKVSMFSQIAKKSVKTADKIGANIAMFGFSKGRRKGLIEKKDIIKFISLLDLNNPALTNLTVTFVDPDTNTPQTKNLKTEAFIADIIYTDKDSPGDELMRDEIMALYNGKRDALKKMHSRFKPLINIELEG
ncbi:hypothetical protein [Listeria booriae]|uniref:hypothetical protein n=1 Tax=Listeria booriae TaxID=1552123 RepID=UPI0016246A65|nr:hypothetical protein [Listeria booriae]MBC1247333.1 hypothetical protein [Listeria booriae]